MNYITRSLIIMLFTLLSIASGLGHAEVSEGSDNTVCFPPTWGGIVAGITLERDLVTLHGEGLYSKWRGHIGGRYYVDSDRSMTMIADVGVDTYIETISIVNDLVRPKDTPDDSIVPVSKRIEVNEGFGNYKKLHLGSTKEQVKENIGEPRKVMTTKEGYEVWYYSTDYDNTTCIAYAEIGITFKDGVVYKVMFHNGC